MSSPENKTDQYLDDLLNGKHPQTEIPNDMQMIDDLVQHYQAKALSTERKQHMWQNAQIPQEKPKRQPKRTQWLWQSVASLVLLVGLFASYTYIRDTVMVNGEQMPIADPYAYGDLALFENPPTFFEYGGYAQIGEYFPAADLMQDAGMRWVGMILYMEEDADTELLRRQIQLAHDNQFKIFISLAGISSGNTANVEDEDFPVYFADFAAQIADAGADAIEIWSDANLDRRLGRLLSTETYALILTETANAIREANPDTLIISGAPAPTGAEAAFPQQVINDDNFLRQLMALGALDAVDCVGMHYNEGIVPPRATTGDKRDDYYTRYLPTMLETYRDILNEQLPICITGIGYFSSEGLNPIPDYVGWAEDTSREEQEVWLVEALDYLAEQDDVPLAIIWHIDYNNMNGAGDAMANGYSLTYPNGE